MSDNRWIIWQNACDATIHKVLKELRIHLRSKAVIPHTDTLDLLEEFDRPEMPESTIDIDSEMPPTLEQLPATKIVKDFRLINEEKDRRIQQAINEIGVPNKDYPTNIANAYDILMGNGICKGEP